MALIDIPGTPDRRLARERDPGGVDVGAVIHVRRARIGKNSNAPAPQHAGGTSNVLRETAQAELCGLGLGLGAGIVGRRLGRGLAHGGHLAAQELGKFDGLRPEEGGSEGQGEGGLAEHVSWLDVEYSVGRLFFPGRGVVGMGCWQPGGGQHIGWRFMFMLCGSPWRLTGLSKDAFEYLSCSLNISFISQNRALIIIALHILHDRE